MDPIIVAIRKEFETNADEKTKSSGQRFFKEEIRMHGVKTDIVAKISKAYYSLIVTRNKTEIFDLCELFWQSGYIEESFVACKWSYFLHKKYDPSDFRIFKNWINFYVNNWASCDTFCNHTVGKFIEMYPEYLSELKEFARSENRWMRRAAAVSLIIPARKGKFLKDIFDIADTLLTDKDDLVRKGYGWMLKAASQAYPKEIFDFVVARKALMPRTALRYAIEKMPDDMRKIAMQK